jgi:hypothetical protein
MEETMKLMKATDDWLDDPPLRKLSHRRRFGDGTPPD